MIRRLLVALLCLLPSLALAQSTPGLYYGQVPTAEQWNSYFAAKQDVLNYIPLNRAGDTALGPVGFSQVFGAGGTPAVAAGAGAGTSPTVSLQNAHDLAFDLTVTTGTSASTSATIVTVTFANTYSNAPHCTFSPLNDNAAGGGAGASRVHENPSSSAWLLVSGGTALADSTTYKWSVVCIG